MLTPEAIAAIAQRKFYVKQLVWATEPIMASRSGAGVAVYAAKGDPLMVMAFDPNVENAYGVRLQLRNNDGSMVETFRNVSVKESFLSAVPVMPDAVSVGL